MRNIMRLGDVASYINGFPFKPSDWSDMGVPIIRIQDLTGNGYQMNRFDGKYDAKYEVRAGDVLISWSASLGVYVWKLETAVLNQHIFKVRFDKVDVDKDFFVYQVECLLKKAARQAHGATMRHLTKPVFDGLPFYLPPKEEQKRIAVQLNAITHLISLRQRQAEKLDELVKARFVEMFGDPCEMLHWECKKIEEVADVTVGVVVKPANFYTDDRLHGVKAFRSLNIGEMKVKDNDWVYFSEEGNAQNAKSQLHEGDVLVVRSGAPGTSCVVTKAYEGCNAIDVIIVHVDGIKLNPYYLCAFNNFPHGMRQMLKGVGGAAQKHLNVGKYNQMIVAIPPMKLQNEFVLFMDSVDCEKDRIQRSAALLETLKRSLMQQYFG